jgi:PIN domain nuclease of toxin-antitoxin system
VTVYLDAHVLVWIAEGDLSKLSQAALDALESGDLLTSPAAILEIEYLYEIGRLNRPVAKIYSFVESALGVRVCTMPFHEVVDHALQEKWTRDPFDRLIVAHAKAAGASLVTKDERIRKHYRRAIW